MCEIGTIFSEFWVKISDISNLMYDLFIGLISSLVFLLLYNYYLKRKNRDKLLILFNIQYDDNINLCYSQVEKSETPVESDLGNTPLMLSDIMSTLLVSNRFEEKVKNIFRFSKNIPGSLYNGNIVTIGGPKFNQQTEFLLGKLGSPLFFKSGKNCLIRKVDGEEIDLNYSVIQLDDNVKEITDYGIIICGKGYIPDLSSTLIIAGYTVFGVLVAAEALARSNSQFMKFVEDNVRQTVKNQKRFAIYFKGKVQIDKNGSPINKIQLYDYKLLTEQEFLEPYPYTY